jgi:hypothetical protein
LTENYEKYLINIDTTIVDFLDTPVYRVFSLEKFLTSLHENSLFLVKTKLWEDPYEAFLLKQLIWKIDGTENYPFSKNYVENFFGQCWTFLNESNLLWKVYAPNNDGIVVKSTIGKIVDLFIKDQPDFGEYYFGKVNYLNEKNICEYYEQEEMVKGLVSEKGKEIIIKSLFEKRIEFKLEEEIRLIFFNTFSCGKNSKITKNGYSLDKKHLFNALADEIIIDPRIDKIRNKSIIDLIKKIGYDGEISQSKLYQLPILKLRTK